MLTQPSLQPHQLSDWRGLHHELLVLAEEQPEASQVGVLVVRQLLLMEELGYHRLHLPEDGLLSQDWGPLLFPAPAPVCLVPWCYGAGGAGLENSCLSPSQQARGVGFSSTPPTPRASNCMTVLLAMMDENHSSFYQAPTACPAFQIHFFISPCKPVSVSADR